MAIMGKKYPSSQEEFNNIFTGGDCQFEPEKAKKRMSVPVPVTWDRELSQGNKAKKEIWENLIKGNNVPYLALIRNLRNILKANHEQATVDKVVKDIQNPKKVEQGKIFPMQYLNAL
jgi:telomerase protein component 1